MSAFRPPKRWVLATDLDGTFLHGSRADRLRFYDWIESQRDRLILVFVTGRRWSRIEPLFDPRGSSAESDAPVPRPDFAIGDVGTTVFDGYGHPVEEIQKEIAARWNGANARVQNLLAGEPGLSTQRGELAYRVSYDYDPKLLRPEAIARLQAAGFDVVMSADRYLDVLPRGVSKGPTLQKLAKLQNWPGDRIVTAGDSLNDLSLLAAGYRAITMGNSEPKLLTALGDRPTVYRSPYPGIWGIVDGLRHWQLGDPF